MRQELSQTQDGYALKSPAGMTMRAISYGAIVTHLHVPDRAGKSQDIVLGFSDEADYRNKPHPYFGTMAGRVAGRISGARFNLDGRSYALAANDPPNHLHGGVRGFDKYTWNAEQLSDQNVHFRLTSAAGDEGYPGRVDASVVYSVSAENAFSVDVEATSDAATPFSLTHHSYFNLAGESSGETIESHELEIFADEYAPGDAHMGLTGRREGVNAGNDFRKPRRMSHAIPHLHARHGDLYFVRRASAKAGELVLAARLTHPKSGRVMNVLTTESCIQLYTGVGLNGSLIGKSGKPMNSLTGMCLECEGYPDGPNTPARGDIILRPGKKAIQRTVYAFSTVK